jgi:hypothetical protein
MRPRIPQPGEGATELNLLAFAPRAPHKNHITMRLYTKTLVSVLALAATLGTALAAENPFVGSWELTIPNGAAGWLGVQEKGGQLEASLLWGGGSVLPLASAKVADSKLVLTRKVENKRAKTNLTETITATLEGDNLKLVSTKPRDNGEGEEKVEFSGKRTPAMPAAPDLKKVKLGKAIQLFDGKDLKGWRVTDPNVPNGWSVKDGIMVNEAKQQPGKPHKRYANIRTDAEFTDFNLKLEVRVAKDGNSGVYLRGIYEVQVCDSYGKALDPHNMGAIYSRITPSVSAEKPAGEWQTLDITFVDRHATVVLNGTKIIDNQPVQGCTGGALWSDVNRPGPIYLQGDHTSVEYRNIVLKPVVK